MAPVQLVLISSLLLTAVRAQSLGVKPVIIPGAANGSRACLSDVAEATTSSIFETVQNQLLRDCGGFDWRQVADLNMADTSQQCPSPWQETTRLARSCRPSASNAGCENASFPVSGGMYTRVCGRAVGYADGSPDAFFKDSRPTPPYLDGVSVTYGPTHQHIWSFAAGQRQTNRCPCENNDRVNAPLPPSWIGENYFCDREFNGALWDGEDCTTSCCTFNSPPYFSVTLPAPTSDAIEVSICTDEGRGNERIQVHLLQLFVQ